MDEDAKKTQSDLKLHLEDSKNIELVAEDLKRKSKENKEKVQQFDLQSAADAVLQKEEDTKTVTDALHTNSPVKPLRTFQGDVADAIERQKASLVKIKLAEEERQRAEILENPHESGARYGIRAIMLVSSIVLILIAGTIFAVTKYVGRAPAAPIEIKYDTLIPYSDVVEMNVSRDGHDDLVSRFTELRGMELTPSSIKYLKLLETAPTGEAVIPTSKFFRILAAKTPQNLVRAFSNTFMAGAYGTSKAEPFILIRVDSFDNAYSGMLEWENTMAEDIGPLFTSENIAFNNGPLPQPISISTSTPATASNTHAESIFDDLVVNNRDTRVVRNEEGKVVFLYSFVDRGLLLMTTNEEAFQGMINKLVASKLIR